jgi:hypothetical protein
LQREPVGDAVHARAAVALDRRAQQPELTDGGDELGRELLRGEELARAGQVALSHEAADGVSDELLFVGEQRVDGGEGFYAEGLGHACGIAAGRCAEKPCASARAVVEEPR